MTLKLRNINCNNLLAKRKILAFSTFQQKTLSALCSSIEKEPISKFFTSIVTFGPGKGKTASSQEFEIFFKI